LARRSIVVRKEDFRPVLLNEVDSNSSMFDEISDEEVKEEKENNDSEGEQSNSESSDPFEEMEPK
tara:strand:- start:180 stop:374 length:195 start_codon:yes stop_codon:yes gene_type:complete